MMACLGLKSKVSGLSAVVCHAALQKARAWPLTWRHNCKLNDLCSSRLSLLSQNGRGPSFEHRLLGDLRRAKAMSALDSSGF